MTTTNNTENKPVANANKKINVKDIDLNALSVSQIMELLAKKEAMAKAETEAAIAATIKSVESNKDILAVFQNTANVKMVVFIDETTGKVKAQYFEKKENSKQHAEDGRASKTIMTIHDMAGNVVLEIKNTRKPEKFFQYLKDNIAEFKDSPLSVIQEKFKESSDNYLNMLQAVDSNKFRIIK